ncbi:MAG TPA: transcription elongation factor subunit Spt4 [Candidatus Nanoarchaeia archaeon]|nr:transcription elongation factor subunit Spt4 [Candidatus Nanoarchaeia archaeon]
MKKKACKRCRMFVDGSECPNCKGNQFATNWKGRLCILDPESGIAKRIGVTQIGEYAIKVR